MNTKHCTSCQTVKPTDDFGRNRAKKDGLQDYCRACNRVSSRLSKAGSRARSCDEVGHTHDREFHRKVNQLWVAVP